MNALSRTSAARDAAVHEGSTTERLTDEGQAERVSANSAALVQSGGVASAIDLARSASRLLDPARSRSPYESVSRLSAFATQLDDRGVERFAGLLRRASAEIAMGLGRASREPAELQAALVALSSIQSAVADHYAAVREVEIEQAGQVSRLEGDPFVAAVGHATSFTEATRPERDITHHAGLRALMESLEAATMTVATELSREAISPLTEGQTRRSETGWSEESRAARRGILRRSGEVQREGRETTHLTVNGPAERAGEALGRAMNLLVRARLVRGRDFSFDVVNIDRTRQHSFAVHHPPRITA